MALIYVIEDDKNISEIESFALKNAGHQIVECASAKEFHKQVADKLPDLILLDIMLPDEDGLTILNKIRNVPETKRIPVIMVTAKTSEYDRIAGLDNGADDYIPKPFGMMELIARVKAMLRRTAQDEKEEEYQIRNLYVSPSRHIVKVDGEPVILTYKEFELLNYFLDNMDIVLTRDKILSKIWGYNFDGETRTVDVHVRTLRQKLGNAGDIIETIRGVGYKIAKP